MALFRYDGKTHRFAAVNEKPSSLSKAARRQVERAPAFFRQKLAEQFERLLRIPLTMPGATQLVFLPRKGAARVVVADDKGRTRAWAAPAWVEGPSPTTPKALSGGRICSLDYNGDGLPDLVRFLADGGAECLRGQDFDAETGWVKIPAPAGACKAAFLGSFRDRLMVWKDEGGRWCGARPLKDGSWSDTVVIHFPEEVAAMTRADLDGDGDPDLVVVLTTGEVKAYSGSNLDFGRLPSPLPGLLGVRIRPGAPVAFGDVTGDGLADLLTLNSLGEVAFLPNQGTSKEPIFHPFQRAPRVRFPADVGYLSRPTFGGLEDAKSKGILVGTKDGRLVSLSPPSWEPGQSISLGAVDSPSPAFGDTNGDGRVELLVGLASGRIVRVSPGAKPVLETLTLEPPAGPYAAPAIADFNGDGRHDLLVGTLEGGLTVYLAEADGKVFKRLSDHPLSRLTVGRSAAPALGDLDGDGKIDLVVGFHDGTLRLYRGPDFGEVKGVFDGVNVGECSAPALGDVDGDGLLDVVVGCVEGTLVFYRNLSRKGTLHFVETESWRFSPSRNHRTLDEYYRVYFPEFRALSGPNDVPTVERYVRLLQGCDDLVFDETAFAVATTPTEVLRCVGRLEEEIIFRRNAELIYALAPKLPYVEIVDEGGLTTLRYKRPGGDTEILPHAIYYWWVVHPRLLYDLPTYVDASYWTREPKEYGQTKDDWLRHVPKKSIYERTDRSVFWREVLAEDRTHGRPLLEAVSESATLDDAWKELHQWLCWQCEGSFMTFGYITADVQPMVIYHKRYGSCGEQSSLCAACARTVLIPTSIVTDRGEDHQWNEVYLGGRWHHWDVNHRTGRDEPWGSTEGVEHKGKTTSAVLRWRADDLQEAVTTSVWNNPEKPYTKRGAGYTDTASLTVFVTDAAQRPVDGAMVILRSHWKRRNMVAEWGYTDLSGECRFDVGFEPHGGYTIEVLTPFGSAGTQNFAVEEGKSYRVEYVLPGAAPVPPLPLGRVAGTGPEKRAWVRAEIIGTFLTPPNMVTSLPPSRPGMAEKRAYVRDKTGYRGTRTFLQPLKKGGEIFLYVLDQENLDLLRRGRDFRALDFVRVEGVASKPVSLRVTDGAFLVVHNRSAIHASTRVRMSLATRFDVAPPVVKLDPPAHTAVDAGHALAFQGKAWDNAKVEKLLFSVDYGSTWKDITPCLDEEGRFRHAWDTGACGPLPPGKYGIVFRAVDVASTPTDTPVTVVQVRGATRFMGQIVRQDDPDSPLPRCSWMMGPFSIDEAERFADFTAKSTTAGFDMDMFLFFDKNQNGRLDGMEEKFEASTTPEANERIYIDAPRKGLYWLYCQGWKVVGEEARMDLTLSFQPRYRMVSEFEPSGHVRKWPQELRCRVAWPAGVDTSFFRVTANGKALPGGPTYSQGVLAWKLDAPPKKEVVFKVRVRSRAGLEETATWKAVLDTEAPTVSIETPTPDQLVKGEMKVAVLARDNRQIARVTWAVDKGKPRPMKPAKVKERYQVKVNLSREKIAQGRHTLRVEVVDLAGNKDFEIVEFVVE
jgi:hypothetical protein